MKRKMNDVFLDHATKWAVAAADQFRSRHPNVRADLDAVLNDPKNRPKLPEYVRLRLGMALHQGLLVASDQPGRGHFLRPQGHPDRADLDDRDHSMMSRSGDLVVPCWEMYVHFAEYAGLIAMAAPYPGLTVGVEESRMDLTVRRDGRLIAYVEVKKMRKDGEKLARELRAHHGKDIPPSSGKNDWEKKINYLVTSRADDRDAEIAFSVRAGDANANIPFEDAFVISLKDDKFFVEELGDPNDHDPLPLHLELRVQHDPLKRAGACLVWHMERNAPVIIRRNEGRYVLYKDREESTPILVATQNDGALYTEPRSLSDEELVAFEARLNADGITLGPDLGSAKAQRMWKSLDGRTVVLADEQRARVLGRDLARIVASNED